MRSFKTIPLAAGLLFLLTASSCDSLIYEDLRECVRTDRVHFIYDHNLRFEDAFKEEVPSVNLYLFDEEGRLVASQSRDVNPNDAEGCVIEFSKLEPGHYNFLAWCGVKENNSFKVNHTDEVIPGFEHHTCRIERNEEGDGAAHVRTDIGRLYHGTIINEDMTQEDGEFCHTVYLKKNTNNVDITLRHNSGGLINDADFEFTITEANGLMASSNELLEDSELTYHPVAQQTIVTPQDQTRRDNNQYEAKASFNVGRLMADRNAILTVKSLKDGSTVISAPLTEFALKVKDHYFEPGTGREISDQEYLDRQDQYSMTFFLSDDEEWLNNMILVNSWRIVLNDNDQIH